MPSARVETQGSVIRTYLIFVTAMCPIYVGFFLYYDAYLSLLGPLAVCVAVVIAWYRYVRGRFGYAGLIVAMTLFFAPAWSMLFSGRLGAGYLLWIGGSIFIAGHLVGSRTALVLGVAAIAYVTAVYLTVSSGIPLPLELPQDAQELAHWLSSASGLGFLTFYGYSMANSYEDLFNEQQATLDELAANEAELKSILSTVPVSVITIDGKGIVTSANEAVKEMTGWQPSCLVGKNIKVIMPPNYQEQHDGFIARYLKTGEAKIIGQGREVEIVKADGTQLHAFLSVGFYNIKGKTYFTGALSDISAIKVREQLLQEHRSTLQQKVDEQTKHLVTAKEVAESANNAKSLFLANISHELRTPMHCILSFSEIGEQKAKKLADGASVLDCFEEINFMGERLMHLLNNLLDLSKMESNKQDYSMAEVDLVQICSGICKSMEGLAQKSNLKLVLAGAPPTAMILADENKIIQVLNNLVSNAVKFAAPNTEVVAEISSSDGITRFNLKNTGPKIPDGELTKVFEAFFQSSNTRKNSGGTGLGLPICKKIIEAHGGDIWATNHENGVAFNFTVPALASQSKSG